MRIKNEDSSLELPIQIDGEAEVLAFEELHLTHLNQVTMLEHQTQVLGLLGILNTQIGGALFSSVGGGHFGF